MEEFVDARRDVAANEAKEGVEYDDDGPKRATVAWR